MRCIFCKQDSSGSKSVEHIIPESLGNKTFILPKGIVCDKCNNYFARKIEAPFLDSTAIKALRFEESIPNKKGHIPPIQGLLNGSPVSLHKISVNSEDPHQVGLVIDIDPDDIRKINDTGHIITPAFTDDSKVENSILISRLIAKFALESLALKVLNTDGWEAFIIDNPDFDPIRDYARRGGSKEWPCKIRRIYGIDQTFVSSEGTSFQIMHESDFLLIPQERINVTASEPILVFLYFVVALWGLEFTINMAGPDRDGLEMYEQWLEEHNRISPLYSGKNKDAYEFSFNKPNWPFLV